MASANPDTHVDVTVQIKAPPAQLDAQLRDLCRRLCGPAWAGAQDSDLSIRAISGGITNLLFKVSHAPSGSAALVRIFGEKTEVLIDREKDNRTFALLAERGFAPTFYGTFTNGRVEGWVESRPLEPAEMAAREPVDFVALIARETARMHVLDMPDERTPILWRFLTKWQEMASEITFDSASSDEKEARKATYLADLDVPRIGRELRWLQTQLPSAGNGDGQALLDAFADSLGPRGDLPSSAAAHTAALTVPRCSDAVSQARVDAAALVFRVVYGHNDLLSGNVLHVRGPDGEPQDVVQIIDYEYGGYNYCGFDVANHFCEHAGFDFDLDKWYPGPDVQHAWFRAYLERLGISLPTAATYAAAGSAGSGSGSGQAGPSSSAPAAEEDAVTAAFLRELGRRVDQFALASHCWWGLWAIVQAKHSPIDFDFISYSRERFRGYDKQKAAFFPGVPLKAE